MDEVSVYFQNKPSGVHLHFLSSLFSVVVTGCLGVGVIQSSSCFIEKVFTNPVYTTYSPSAARQGDDKQSREILDQIQIKRSCQLTIVSD